MRHIDIINVIDPGQPFYDEVGAGSRETVDAYLERGDYEGAAQFQREMIGLLEDLAPSSIGKDWRKAIRSQFKNPRAATAWKARGLNLDPDDPHMSIALACFAPMKLDTWRIAIPLPLPRPMGPKYAEPDEIVLICPETGSASLYSGDTDVLTAIPTGDHFTVQADAKAWAREIAAAIVEWFYRCDQARRIANITPSWTGKPPSSLAVGDVRKIEWPHVRSITAGDGIDAALLKKAIFRQARITHVESPMQIGRAA